MIVLMKQNLDGVVQIPDIARAWQKYTRPTVPLGEPVDTKRWPLRPKRRVVTISARDPANSTALATSTTQNMCIVSRWTCSWSSAVRKANTRIGTSTNSKDVQTKAVLPLAARPVRRLIIDFHTEIYAEPLHWYVWLQPKTNTATTDTSATALGDLALSHCIIVEFCGQLEPTSWCRVHEQTWKLRR